MKLTQYIAISIAIFSSIVIAEISIASTDRISLDRSIFHTSNLYIAQNNTEASKYFNSGDKKHHKDVQGALADYNKAIEINPEHIDAYKARGVVKTDLNDSQGAMDDFLQGAKLFNERKAALDFFEELDNK
jgi:tetratricopeptide (TPR) repeat protein